MIVGVFRKSFDPFAPHWLFLTGFAQVYVVQAITAREWAIRIRGTRAGDGRECPRVLGAALVPAGLLLRARQVDLLDAPQAARPLVAAA